MANRPTVDQTGFIGPWKRNDEGTKLRLFLDKLRRQRRVVFILLLWQCVGLTIYLFGNKCGLWNYIRCLRFSYVPPNPTIKTEVSATVKTEVPQALVVPITTPTPTSSSIDYKPQAPGWFRHESGSTKLNPIISFSDVGITPPVEYEKATPTEIIAAEAEWWRQHPPEEKPALIKDSASVSMPDLSPAPKPLHAFTPIPEEYHYSREDGIELDRQNRAALGQKLRNDITYVTIEEDPSQR